MAVEGVLSGLAQELTAVQRKVEDSDSIADQWKNIRRQRVQREVMKDPKLAMKLVALEASPIYNSKGEIIQSTGLDVS